MGTEMGGTNQTSGSANEKLKLKINIRNINTVSVSVQSEQRKVLNYLKVSL
jgi:hypothetical protein